MKGMGAEVSVGDSATVAGMNGKVVWTKRESAFSVCPAWFFPLQTMEHDTQFIISVAGNRWIPDWWPAPPTKEGLAK